MALPGLTNTVLDGQLGLVSAAADKPLVIGPTELGAPNTLYTFAKPKGTGGVLDTVGRRQAPECAGHILAVAGGSLDILSVAASVAGVIGSVTQFGGGPAVTVTVTPQNAGQAWQIDDPGGTPVYVDETADFASSATGDVNPWPATEAIGDQFAIGSRGPFNSLTITVATAGTVGTLTWKYWNGTAWAALSGVTDATTGFTVLGTNTVTWTMPTDWKPRALNGSASLFYVVAEVATTYTIDPILTSGTVNNQGPNDFYDVTVTVKAGGVLGTGTFDFTLDGKKTTSETRTIPAGGIFDVPNTGLRLTFAGGTYVVGTTYAFTTRPRTFNATDLSNAITALLLLNGRWKYVVFAGESADATTGAVLAAAINGHMTSLANDLKYDRAVVDTGRDTSANVITQYTTVSDRRLALFYERTRIPSALAFEGWGSPMLPGIYSAAARIAQVKRSTSPAWVGFGALVGVSEIGFNEGETGETLHQHKINTFRTLPGQSGFFLTNGKLKSPSGSDFKYIQWGMIVDLVCNVITDALTPFINGSRRILTDGTGRIDPRDAARINKKVNGALKTALLDPKNDEGYEGLVSAVAYAVDESVNLLTSGILQGDVRIVPLAQTEQVATNIGLALEIAA